MIVTDFENIKNTDREVKDPNGKWTSLRKFIADQGLGYSFHRTTIEPNKEIYMEYKNHIELVSIIQGTGTLEDKATGKVYDLKPGVTYLLDKHDAHILKSGSEGTQMLCIFTPAITGKEVHDKDGAYPAIKENNT